jgi:hypothetical protein
MHSTQEIPHFAATGRHVRLPGELTLESGEISG